MSQPHLFVALYSGETVGSAQIISASVDTELVSHAIAVMLDRLQQQPSASPTVEAVRQGRRNALMLADQGMQK